jgi:hypothetical protein
MKKTIALSTIALAFGIFAAQAQPHGGMGGPGGPRFDGEMIKLFGDNPAFSANLEIQTAGGSARGLNGGGTMTMPGRIEVLNGATRFEMDMTKMTGANVPPQAAEQMKKMGMDKLETITLPDKNTSYMIYPCLNGYMETPLPDSAAASASDFKMDVTKVGEEKMDGHACVKNKVVVTDKEGKTHASTVWNATDLHNFPVRIEMADHGANAVMTFKDVKLSKPPEADFAPPAGAKKYKNFMEIMMSRNPNNGQ